MSTDSIQATSRRHYPCLNAVRAAAALGVVATHVAFDTGEVARGWPGAVLSRLDFGVTLFFVLSGFLLSHPFLQRVALGSTHPSYTHYLWKRFLRIMPLYVVTVVVALGLLSANQDAGVDVWVRNLTLTQIYHPGLLPTGLTQMWSLCTEVAFYALLPAIVWALVRITCHRRWRPGRLLVALGVVACAGVAWQVVVSGATRNVTHQAQWLPGYLPWFAIGMAFAVVSVTREWSPAAGRLSLLDRLGTDLAGCWIFAAGVFAIACTPIAGPRVLTPPSAWEAFFKCTLYGVTAAFLVLPLVFGPEREGWARRACINPVAVWLGEVSYGIFCIHLIVLEVVMRVLDVPVFTGRFQDVFLMTVLGTTVLAAMSYYVLERPLLRLKNVGPFATAAVTKQATATTASP